MSGGKMKPPMMPVRFEAARTSYYTEEGEERAFFEARVAREELCGSIDPTGDAIQYFLRLGIRKNIATTSNASRAEQGIPAASEYRTRNDAINAARAAVKRK